MLLLRRLCILALAFSPVTSVAETRFAKKVRVALEKAAADALRVLPAALAVDANAPVRDGTTVVAKRQGGSFANADASNDGTNDPPVHGLDLILQGEAAVVIVVSVSSVTIVRPDAGADDPPAHGPEDDTEDPSVQEAGGGEPFVHGPEVDVDEPSVDDASADNAFVADADDPVVHGPEADADDSSVHEADADDPAVHGPEADADDSSVHEAGGDEPCVHGRDLHQEGELFAREGDTPAPDSPEQDAADDAPNIDVAPPAQATPFQPQVPVMEPQDDAHEDDGQVPLGAPPDVRSIGGANSSIVPGVVSRSPQS
jgi:hypothetical protein